MNDLTVKNVDFLGDTLIAAQDKDGNIWAGVSYICKGIGLDKNQKDWQVKTIQSDLVLSRGCGEFSAGVFDKNNKTKGIRIDYIPLWLAKIPVTPAMQENNPRLVEKLVEYQLKAKDVLAAAFLPTYSINNIQPQPIPLKEQLEAVSFIADDLHVTKSSRIIMYKKLCESNHVSTQFLPDYVEGEDKEAKSATILLKQFDLKMSTVSFNKLLLNAGILEERERNSIKGTVKKFKALTENGLKYGKNLTSEQNPKEVQPYYYVDTFMELYHLVTSANVA